MAEPNIGVGDDEGGALLRKLLGWDAKWYLERYPDIATAFEKGAISDPIHHYVSYGRLEGRFPSAAAEQEAQRTLNSPLPGGTAQFELGKHSIPANWPVTGEIGKTFLLKFASGFFKKYMSGNIILDVGFRGANANAVPIFPHAIGIDLDYPGYDGVRLPFDDGSVDSVFSSHILEHVLDSKAIIRDWFRTLKIGGFIVCIVPHQYLYERKIGPPSQWSGQHVRFFTPASLLRDFEECLTPNTYRVRHLADNDMGYLYDRPPDHHPGVCYEIELVIEKIKPPPWTLILD